MLYLLSEPSVAVLCPLLSEALVSDGVWAAASSSSEKNGRGRWRTTTWLQLQRLLCQVGVGDNGPGNVACAQLWVDELLSELNMGCRALLGSKAS